METAGPAGAKPVAQSNEEAHQAWDGPLFDRFVEFRDLLTTGLGAHGEAALAAQRAMSAGDNDHAHPGRVQVARFFADNIAPMAAGLADVVVGGAASLAEAQQMWVE